MKVKTIDPSHLNDEDLAKIINHYYEIINNNPSEYEKFKTIIKDSQSSTRKWDATGFVSKSTVCRIKNTNYDDLKQINLTETDYLVAIAFMHFKGTRGRRPIAAWLRTTYQIKISSATVGRSLLKQGLKTITRLKSNAKPKETKDLSQMIDYVSRDYNNHRTLALIIATDVTFIPFKTKSGKWIYLSVAISHRTKQIISYGISLTNDVSYIYHHIKAIDAKPGTIIHSDHGSQYFATIYRNMLKQKGWIQSMTRIGNCLDNREVEHWFGVFKTEWLYHQDLTNWSLEQLKQAIAKFIDYYNNERQQECLGWLTPNQFALKFQ